MVVYRHNHNRLERDAVDGGYYRRSTNCVVLSAVVGHLAVFSSSEPRCVTDVSNAGRRLGCSPPLPTNAFLAAGRQNAVGRNERGKIHSKKADEVLFGDEARPIMVSRDLSNARFDTPSISKRYLTD